MAKVAAIRSPREGWRAPPGRPRKTQIEEDLRDALRGKIRAADLAKERLAAHVRGIDRAEQLVREASTALEKVRAAQAEAKQENARNLAVSIGGIVGRAAPPNNQTTLQGATEQEAAEKLETARAALAHLQLSLGEAERLVHQADAETLTAVNAFLAPLMAKLLAQADEHRRKFVAMRVALKALSEDFSSPPRFSHEEAAASIRAQASRVAALGELKQAAEEFGALGAFHTADEQTEVEWHVLASWRQAREALRTDADAPLPAI